MPALSACKQVCITNDPANVVELKKMFYKIAEAAFCYDSFEFIADPTLHLQILKDINSLLCAGGVKDLVGCQGTLALTHDAVLHSQKVSGDLNAFVCDDAQADFNFTKTFDGKIARLRSASAKLKSEDPQALRVAHLGIAKADLLLKMVRELWEQRKKTAAAALDAAVQRLAGIIYGIGSDATYWALSLNDKTSVNEVYKHAAASIRAQVGEIATLNDALANAAADRH